MKKILVLLILVFGFASMAFGKEIILDVRTPKEFEQEHIPQAINIDVLNSNFKTEVSKLNRDDNFRVYCLHGKRAAQAVSIMKDLGFKHLENLGGFEEAKKALEQTPPK